MPEEIGTIIREARERRRWTQEAMAEKLGISLRQYSKYESGDLPKYKTTIAETIDKLLGTNVRELFYEQNVPRVTEGAKARDWTDAEVVKAKPEVQVAAAIREITESARLQAIANSEQALANKQQAEANYLSEKNRARILEILQPTAGADPQTIEATIATVLGLRKYIAQLAADLKNEPLAAIVDEIDKIVLEEKSRVQSTGSPAGVGM